MLYENITRADRFAVEWALGFLSRHAFGEYSHFIKVVQKIRVVTMGCGAAGAIACVTEQVPWTVTFAVRPAGMPCLELPITLAHEARHVHVCGYGTWHVTHHTWGRSLPACLIIRET